MIHEAPSDGGPSAQFRPLVPPARLRAMLGGGSVLGVFHRAAHPSADSGGGGGGGGGSAGPVWPGSANWIDELLVIDPVGHC
jgi:hypothetical protein